MTAVLLILAACGGANRPAASVPLGRDFVLAPGHSTRVDSLTVKFETVANDSRCPEHVQCVWEGDATVVVTLRSSSSPATPYELHTVRRTAREVSYDGYLVRLVDLRPASQPGPGVPDYRAVLRVTRPGAP